MIPRWLLWLWSIYCWRHGYPNRYPSASAIFEGMRTQMWLRVMHQSALASMHTQIANAKFERSKAILFHPASFGAKGTRLGHLLNTP